MKKFYSIKSALAVACALLANVAAGQSLMVTSNGEEVENGAVIELPYELEANEYPEFDLYDYTYTWDPQIEVASDEENTKLTITVSSEKNDDDFQLCWPGNCIPRKTGESVSSTGKIGPEWQLVNLHKAVSFDKKGEVPEVAPVVKITFETASETMEITVKCLLTDSNAVDENFAESNEPASYYTLDGVKIENPTQKGMYIIRKGGKAKVFLKK